jgi:hypothetical protein
VLPGNNPITESFAGELRRFGVDASMIVRQKGRFGIYFVEPGANQRPSKVVYDREGSSIALAKPGDIDWAKSLDGGGWFHITGITPAIKLPAAAAVVRMKHPGETSRLFKITFQSFVGFLNIAAAQKGVGPLEMNTEKIGDALMISSPEYAHGVPGSLKNLLDCSAQPILLS